MAQSVGTVNVELKANTATFVTGMSKAGYAAKQAGNDIRKAFANLGDAATTALSPFGEISVVAGEAFKSIGNLAANAAKSFPELAAAAGTLATGFGVTAAAALAVGGAMAKLAIDGAEVVERLSLISQKTGISIADLQSFEAAGATVGVSLEDMVTGMRKFDQSLTGTSKQAALAKVVLQQLGVTSKDPKEAILQVADAFSKMKDGTIKSAEALALFGRSGLQLIPLLNLGRVGFEEATDAVAKFGPAISGPALAATEKWKESTRDLKLAWDSVTTGLTSNVLPAVSDFVERIAKLTKGISDLAHSITSNPLFKAGALLAFPLLPDIFSKKDQAPIGGPGTFETDEHVKQFFPIGGLDTFKRQAAEAYDVLKAGSAAANDLEKKRIELQGWEMVNNYGMATLLHGQVEELEKVVALEALRRKESERVLASQQGIAAALARQGAGGAKPLFPLDRPAQLAQGASAPAPDTLIPEEALEAVRTALGNVISGSLVEGTAIGLAKLAEFYDKFKSDNKKALDVINADYQNWTNTFVGLLARGEITEKQFADVSVALEQDRLKKILKSRDDEIRTWDEEALKFGSFKDKFQALTNQMVLDGQSLGGKIFESFHKAIDDLSSKLAQLVVTGKANFKELFQSLAESIAKSGFQSLFGQVAKGIQGKLGIALPGLGGKADGSASSPYYMVPVDAGGKVLGGLFGGKSGLGGGPLGAAGGADDGSDAGGAPSGISGFLSSFTSKLQSTFSSIFSSISGVLSKIVGGIGSGISGIASFFGGLLASGGPVTPGHAYIVGEKHPEFFVPRQPGHVATSLAMGGGHVTHNVINFNVHTPDADSFRKSKGQWMADFQHQLAYAHSRNR